MKHVTDMNQLFFNMVSFNSDISNWDVGAVTNMESMFGGASSFNSDISSWDVSFVRSSFGMFVGQQTSILTFQSGT